MAEVGTKSKLSKKTYMPYIENSKIPEYPVEGQDDGSVDALYQTIRDSPDQQRNREAMGLHLLLEQAAQQKANDMARLGYFGHTSPSGVSANQNVRNTGYRLPEWYPVDGNNVESLYIGTDKPKDAAAAWFASDHHRPHVYGQDAFFRDQNCIGVGYAPFPKEEHRGYWVFISAPCLA